MSANKTAAGGRNRGQELIDYGKKLKQDSIVLGIIVAVILALSNLTAILSFSDGHFIIWLVESFLITFVLYRIANFCEMILGALGEKMILSEQTNQLLTDIKAKVPSPFLPQKDSDAIDDLDDLDDVLNGKSPFKPMGQSPFKPLSDK